MGPRSAGGFLRLDKGQVDIWLTQLSEVTSNDTDSYVRLLTPEEFGRYSRFVVADPKNQYLVARWLLRTTLSRYANVPLSEWTFDTNSYGRPHISTPAEYRDIRFNLSHTTGLVACAIAKNCDVGIDVEYVNRYIDIYSLAHHVFSKHERDDLISQQPELQMNRFFSFWTLKEAYIKARGMGLSLPLDGFYFDLDAEFPRIHFNDSCPDDPRRWRFRQFVPTPDHKLAIAVSSAPAEFEVSLRWAIPSP